jgi:O-antigen ligase
VIWCSRLTIALVAWGALSFGAVYPWGYWPLAIGAFYVGLWSILTTRALAEPRPREVAIGLGLVAAAMLVQAIPLPYGWFRAISPAADRLLAQLQFGYALSPPASHTLSVDPAGTLTSLGIFAALGVFLVGMMRAVSYMPLRWMVGQLTLFGIGLALFGIVQRLLAGASDYPLYGFWKPSGFATPFGPFINRNHFAGWMVLMLPLAVASASANVQMARGPFLRDWKHWVRWLSTPDANRFVFTSVAALIMAVALVLTGSRSGLISLAAALVVLGAFAVRATSFRLRKVLPAFYFGIVLIAAVGWVGVERTAARFEQASGELGERMAAWRDTLSIIRDFPVAGTGVGGYGQAMLAYQTAERHSIYQQAHNEYLQVLAEGGLLLGIPVVIAAVILVRHIRHRFRGSDDLPTFWLRAGVVAGLAGIAVQSLLEFSLQMPGNALLFALLLAIAMHRPSSRHHADRV